MQMEFGLIDWFINWLTFGFVLALVIHRIFKK